MQSVWGPPSGRDLTLVTALGPTSSPSILYYVQSATCVLLRPPVTPNMVPGTSYMLNTYVLIKRMNI